MQTSVSGSDSLVPAAIQARCAEMRAGRGELRSRGQVELDVRHEIDTERRQRFVHRNTLSVCDITASLTHREWIFYDVTQA